MLRIVSKDLRERGVLIYGTGGLARMLCELLARYSVEVTAYVESPPSRESRRFLDCPLMDAPTAVELVQCKGLLVLVASSWYRDISINLQALGLREGLDFVDAVRFAVEEDYLALEAGLEGYRGCHAGERAFLVGNGPSLRKEDLDMLRGEVCFAANKIFLAYDSTEWRPDYYCVCDPQVSLINQERIREIDTPKFLANSTCFYGEQVANGFVLPYFFRNRTDAGRNPRFSENPVDGLYDGGTVIYMMMQLAYFMGVRELYLIGLDHNFSIPKGVKGALLPGGGQNHFHPGYRPKGENWSRPDFDFMNRSFEFAKGFLAERDVRVYNASRKTALKTFPLVSLESVFAV